MVCCSIPIFLVLLLYVVPHCLWKNGVRYASWFVTTRFDQHLTSNWQTAGWMLHTFGTSHSMCLRVSVWLSLRITFLCICIRKDTTHLSLLFSWAVLLCSIHHWLAMVAFYSLQIGHWTQGAWSASLDFLRWYSCSCFGSCSLHLHSRLWCQ